VALYIVHYDPAVPRTANKKCYWLGHTMRIYDSVAKQTLQWTPQRRRGRGLATNEQLEKKSLERNLDSRIKVQLETNEVGRHPMTQHGRGRYPSVPTYGYATVGG